MLGLGLGLDTKTLALPIWRPRPRSGSHSATMRQPSAATPGIRVKDQEFWIWWGCLHDVGLR